MGHTPAYQTLWVHDLRLQYKKVLEASIIGALCIAFTILHTLKIKVGEHRVVQPPS